MQVLNHLSRAPKPIDTIPFLAFVAPNGDASKLIEEPNSQTPNITPTESVRLLTECLKWLFEYGPRIVTLVEQARSTLLSAPPGTAPKETNKKIKNLIRAEIDQLVSSGQIPGSGTINEKEPGLQHLVGLSMCAAGCIIAIIGLTQKKLSNSREFLVDYSTPEVMQAIGSD
jgi:hypothetical protein